MNGPRIGVFGGTFDPIHLGHLAVVADAAAALDLESVLFVPNFQSPHKAGYAVSSPEDRVQMVTLALEGNDLFKLCHVELKRQGKSYTLDTMRQLAASDSRSTFIFLTGADSLPQLHTWHQPDDLLAEFSVVVMDRPSRVVVDWKSIEARFPGIRERVQILKLARLEISGDDIRDRIRQGRPFRYFLPPAVYAYIQDRGLYRGRG